ncbi:MAG: right-handed parallel beta-helix repeat-containing protein, partial [Candidatus Marinimicrobia bacterium]|nr:right-handed parallel beta-helix repeat-containing protein [Candidatus Neomarinimicrobiota bacterium]
SYCTSNSGITVRTDRNSHLTLTTGNTSYISQTVIDGNQENSVVTFSYGSTSGAVLSGFTIQNGNAYAGGGIYCHAGSSPTLVNLKVSGNTSSYEGGGIYCQNSTLSLENLTISGNWSGHGAGIFCHNSSPVLKNVTISGNRSDVKGGGILFSGPSLSLINTTISGNIAGYGGGLYCGAASIDLINTIVWNNSPQEIYFDQVGEPNSITISYSDIQDGQDSIVTNDNDTVIWGDGNIIVDPRFIDPDNGNYNLLASSLCINAGHPDSTDTDGTRADMGAYPYLNTYSGPDWYVNTSGNDTIANGSSAAPFKSIQAGINFATTTGDSVSVAAGTYVENINFRGGDVKVFGEQGAENTIIDGNQNGSVVSFVSGESELAELMGFTLRNGNGTNISNAGWGINGTVGGGIFCDNGSSPSLLNLKLTQNSVNQSGGGCAFFSDSNPILTNIEIVNNSAVKWGGGIYLFATSSPTIVKCLISDNTSDGGSGIGAQYNCSPNISNTLICYNNGTGWSGAVEFQYNSDPIFRNVSIINNAASWNTGGGLYLYAECKPKLINTILWNNKPREIWFEHVEGYVENELTVSYSCLQNGLDSIATNNFGTVNWLSGNIDAYPQFVDSANGDFRLADNSPCIARGADSVQINGTWYYTPTTDLDGNPRPRPFGTAPDIGAYENQTALPDTTFITGGTISTDSTWSKARSPYVISGDVVIDAGVTLTIEPGVEVYFARVNIDPELPTIRLHIEGNLIAEGTLTDSIRFDDFYGSRSSESWDGFHINATGDQLNSGNVTFSYSIIENIRGTGFDLWWYDTLYIEHSRISDCGIGIRTMNNEFVNPFASIKNNTIQDCQYGIRLSTNFGTTIIRNNDFIDDDAGIEFTECQQSLSNVDISYNNFYINQYLNWAVRNNTVFYQNLKYNYWGLDASTEMNAGGNPKDITTIHDYFDEAQFGIVDYSHWLDAPWPDGQPVGDTYDAELLVTDNQYSNEMLTYHSGDSIFFQVTDIDRNTNDAAIEQITIQVWSETEAAEETVTLTETGNATNIFQSNIPLDESSSAVADGQLQVSHGDWMYFQYIDPANDYGNVDTVSYRVIFDATIFSGGYYASQDTVRININESPFILIDDIQLNTQVLFIEAGSEIYVLDHDSVSYDGESPGIIRIRLDGASILNAVGTESDSIKIIPYRNSNSYVWGGIDFDYRTVAVQSKLSYCVISGAEKAISHGDDGYWDVVDTLTISNCLISESRYGIVIDDSGTVNIDNCSLQDCESAIVLGHDNYNRPIDKVTISNCNFSNYQIAIGLQNEPTIASITYNNFNNSSYSNKVVLYGIVSFLVETKGKLLADLG